MCVALGSVKEIWKMEKMEIEGKYVFIDGKGIKKENCRNIIFSFKI